ncbi:hypothetical protein GP5015_2467 [gamma proteobacterium HTCC5015]|nr:hypothetical protein GP5015_2467 [gamma proteobacterium HTCC5015]
MFGWLNGGDDFANDVGVVKKVLTKTFTGAVLHEEIPCG